MANDDTKGLAQKRASDVLRDTDRKSVGLVRIVAESAGTPGEVREYESGDEALVEAGQAQWVVAPVHSPAAGRRLDTDAEREATPAGGIEAFPPADGDPFRDEEARRKGYVEAASDTGATEKLAAKRVEAARGAADVSDAKAQAAAGGFGARSGPADLSASKLLEQSDVETVDSGSQSGSKSARSTSRSSKEP